ncbi:MAG: hypothetical protein J0L64_26345 [Acidobacteria bacterium]|nr:hypothetical protein [Acidobacteriota bacterium]
MLCLLMAGCLQADWRLFRTGAADVYAESAEGEARAALNRLEQVRFLVGTWSGVAEPQGRWPVRVVLFKPGKTQTLRPTPELELLDGVWSGAWPANQPLPREWLRGYARELWEANAKPMAGNYDAALIDLLSTLEAKATRIQLGAPPPEEARTNEWMLLHLLATTEEFQGRMRVLLSNLQQGAALDIALKNSYDKPPKEMMAMAEAHGKSGQFAAAEWVGAPLNPERDFRAREIEAGLVKLALAGVQKGEARRKAFLGLLNDGVKTPVTLEGAGLHAEAVEAGSESATAWLQAALAEKDAAKREKLLVRASELNPRWAGPHARIALDTQELGHKIGRMKKAVSLEPRHGDWWRQLAEWQYEGRLYRDAAASFLSAARWAATAGESARMQRRWKELEEARGALESAERKRIEDEKQAALEKLRLESLERIRAAEMKARGEMGGAEGTEKAVEWWEGPAADGKAEGMMERVECGKQLVVLHVKGGDGKLVKLGVADPGKVVFMGGGELTLACGVQKPARRVRVEYRTKADAKTGVAGEVAVIEFLQ